MQLSVPGVVVDGTSPVIAIPARVDVVVYQGQDTVVSVPVVGSNGSTFSLAGFTAKLVIKDRLLPSSGTPTTSKSYTGTISTNVATFTIPGSDLKALSLVGYWWDVFITSGSGARDEVVPTGTMTVNAAVGA